MKTSKRWGNLRVMAGMWLLVPGCGAFSGGQSGTDSLEAIGVVRPETMCESRTGTGEVGDVIESANGCEQCVCESSGEWNCEAVGCESGDDAPAGDRLDSTDATAGSESSPDDEEALAPAPTLDAAVATTDPQSDECLTELAEPSLGSSNAVYVAKDERATVCLSPVSPTKLCMNGSMVASGEDYAYWGGGLGFVMSSQLDGGIAPFDAARLGIEGLRFTVEGVRPPYMLNVYFNQVDAPNISNPQHNFVQNSFSSLQLSENGVFETYFLNVALPSWTSLDVDDDSQPDPDVPFDASQLNSVQFFVPANVYSGFDFDVCISDLQWIDANGDVVSLQ